MMTRLTKSQSSALARSRVGVAGAGGLGSNCAMALARAGVGTLRILDFDTVEESNLNRQAYTLDQVGKPKVEALRANILTANPRCQVEAVNGRYEPGDAKALFGGCQVVVEAFDAPRYKAAIIEDVLTTMPEAFVVSGIGIAGIGGNIALTTRREGRLYVVGDGKTEAAKGVPLLAPRVMAVAAMQANMALALLLGDEDP